MPTPSDTLNKAGPTMQLRAPTWIGLSGCVTSILSRRKGRDDRARQPTRQPRQLKPDTNAATINRLHDEARALEDEIRFGHVFQMLGGAGFGLGGGGSAESGPGAAPSASHL